MYGQSLYGTNAFGVNSILAEEILQEYKVDLYKYIPLVIQNMVPIRRILDIQATQLGIIKYQIDDILKQCFIDTATWGLDAWEEEYGIETNKSFSYEDRREVVKAKKRGRGTTTIEMIKNTAIAFSGGECEVIEHNDQYYFTVHFIGFKGIPRNMQAFIDQLEIIKPAHLGIAFEYTYNTYGDIKANKWDYDRLTHYSHEDIRTTEDIIKGLEV